MSNINGVDVHQHGIYLVTKDIYVAYDAHRGGERRKSDPCSLRKLVIPAGELLEMRYFSPAHFRDIHNHYFVVDDAQIKKLQHVAEILPEVASHNVADLHDILRLHLYREVSGLDTRTAWHERSQMLQRHFKGVYTRDTY